MFDCCAVREPASARMLQPGDGGDSRRGVGSQQTPKKRSVRLAAPAIAGIGVVLHGDQACPPRAPLAKPGASLGAGARRGARRG